MGLVAYEGRGLSEQLLQACQLGWSQNLLNCELIFFLLGSHHPLNPLHLGGIHLKPSATRTTATRPAGAATAWTTVTTLATRATVSPRVLGLILLCETDESE